MDVNFKQYVINSTEFWRYKQAPIPVMLTRRTSYVCPSPRPHVTTTPPLPQYCAPQRPKRRNPAKRERRNWRTGHMHSAWKKATLVNGANR